MWALVPKLEKVEQTKDDEIYKEGDPCEEMFFIKTGKVKIYDEDNGLPFASYNNGDLFGFHECLLRTNRDGKGSGLGRLRPLLTQQEETRLAL